MASKVINIETYDDTIDGIFEKRCMTFLMGMSKCSSGEYCNKYHIYPKEDGVMCQFFKDGHCHRSEETCWFLHRPGQSNKRVEPEVKEYNYNYNVEPMGHLMKRLREEERNKSRKEGAALQVAANKRGPYCEHINYIERLNYCEMEGKMVYYCGICESNNKLK